MADKGINHKHVTPLTVGIALAAIGALGYSGLDTRLNLILAGVVTFLIAGLWHDKMCKMG